MHPIFEVSAAAFRADKGQGPGIEIEIGPDQGQIDHAAPFAIPAPRGQAHIGFEKISGGARGHGERLANKVHGFSTDLRAMFCRCSPVCAEALSQRICRRHCKYWRKMVGDTGIEPVTPPV